MTIVCECGRLNRIRELFRVTSLASLYDRTAGRKYLNKAERLAFYRSAQLIEDDSHRAFCLTLFYTGCRISEALALKPSSIDQGESSLVFRTLKQRKQIRQRGLPIPNAHAMLLRSCCRDGRSRIWDFGRTTAWAIIKDCMASAGLDGIKATPKGLRHGFAIACISEGVPITKLQKLLGHARLETTGIYLDYVGDDERALVKRVWLRESKHGTMITMVCVAIFACLLRRKSPK